MKNRNKEGSISMSLFNYTDALGAIDYQRIKLLNPLVAYCENHGIQLKRSSNRWKGKCPLHNEQNGEAFVIHPDQKWQCYGQCARQGDVIDLEMLLYGGTVAEAARRLDGITPTGVIPPVSKTPIGVLETQKPLPTKENPLALSYVLSDREIRDCHRFTVRLLEDRQYMERCSKHRQWKLETIRDLALDGYLGLDNEGHFCFNSASGCKSRWREDGERRFKFLFGKSWLWRGELIPEAGTVYITEGETDAITLIDCGMEEDGQTVIVAMQGATFNIEPWSFLFNGKDVIISTDYDEAGRKAADKIEIALFDVARSISFLNLSESGEVVRA
jgi:NAD-dependent dihydropyrimidine dehydrogenase PreA subunit